MRRNDANNQAGVLGRFDPDALALLKGMHPANVPLRTNCRNTAQILTRIQSALNVDMGNASVGNGPEVSEIAVRCHPGLQRA